MSPILVNSVQYFNIMLNLIVDLKICLALMKSLRKDEKL